MVFSSGRPRKPILILVAGSQVLWQQIPNAVASGSDFWNWVTGISWKSFEMHIFKSLDCLKETIKNIWTLKVIQLISQKE